MIATPINTPAFNSNKVRSRKVRKEKQPTTMAAAAKRREFLKKEAQDTLTVHYQKEVDREP